MMAARGYFQRFLLGMIIKRPPCGGLWSLSAMLYDNLTVVPVNLCDAATAYRLCLSSLRCCNSL